MALLDANVRNLSGPQAANPTRARRLSKDKFDLRFQAAVVGSFVEAFAILPAGDLVGKSEVRRRDVPNNRAGIRVVQHVADRQADAQVEAVRRCRGADEAAKAAAGGGLHWVASPASGARIAGSAALLAEPDDLCDAKVYAVLAGSSSEIARQEPLAGRWVRIE